MDKIDVTLKLQNYLQRRMYFGVRKYGTSLQTNNGRDGLVDAFEEAVDLCSYLAQVILERDGKLPDIDSQPPPTQELT